MIFSDKKGQGLIELIIAIAVITTGLFSIWTLFLSNFNGEQEAKARVIGANLAREGMEAVKNIRDSNWLYADENKIIDGQFWTWDHNLNSGSFFYLKNIKGEDETLENLDLRDLMVLATSSNPIEDKKIYISSDAESEGLFNDVSENAKYSGYVRVISIKNICCEIAEPADAFKYQCKNQNFVVQDSDCPNLSIKIGIDVKSEVEWIIKDKKRKVTIEDQLFNWR